MGAAAGDAVANDERVELIIPLGLPRELEVDKLLNLFIGGLAEQAETIKEPAAVGVGDEHRVTGGVQGD